MAAAFQEQCCSICELQHLTHKAEEWCPECDEYLCSNCKTHHKLAKATRRHKTVAMSDLKELPSFVSAIKIECDAHHENYEYFCPKHEIPICVICAEKHTQCGQFTILRKLEGTKTSAGMVKVEKNIRDIQKNLEVFLQNRQSNLSNLKDQQASCREKVKEIRLKIDRHLDKLEKTAIDEIDNSYIKHKSEIEQIINNLSAHKMKIEAIQNNIDKIKEHASEIQIFLSIQDIENKIKEEGTQMVTIGQFKLLEIELSFIPTISCTSGIILESFGELKTNTNPVDINFVRHEDSEAQLFMPGTNKKHIDQISITKKLGFTLPTILGEVKVEYCCNTDEGLLLLTDGGKKSRIIVLESNGALVCEIPLQHIPHDVISFNKTLYVSSFSSMTLTSIDFETTEVKQIIKTGHNCDALALAGDKILLHLHNFEYKIYDLNLIEVGKIPIRMEFAPSLSYCDEKIYFAQWKENTVYCHNMAGIMIWKFQNKDIRAPSGIAIDSYGNVFVTGAFSKNIAVISPNGEHSRNLLNLTDVLAYPTAVHYNQS
ncbi:uncharacterized protein LOC127734902 [Mytilus californianus]|uniref:uncharacterized protein LOC127734902 n=1 Tax=Mytilus californianus TaxID=6549 RepID=UPI002245C8AD|nr:uncharacterized protein LOC127734902 [Mytilus californianus]